MTATANLREPDNNDEIIAYLHDRTHYNFVLRRCSFTPVTISRVCDNKGQMSNRMERNRATGRPDKTAPPPMFLFDTQAPP